MQIRSGPEMEMAQNENGARLLRNSHERFLLGDFYFSCVAAVDL